MSRTPAELLEVGGEHFGATRASRLERRAALEIDGSVDADVQGRAASGERSCGEREREAHDVLRPQRRASLTA